MGQSIWVYVLVLIALIIIISIAADSNRFVSRVYRIDSGRPDKPVSFIFISDLHNKQYGKDNCKLIDAIDEMKPDAILIGGDMISAHKGKTLEPALKLVKTLAGKYPVYYGSGNHEQRLFLYPERYGDMSQELESSLSEYGVIRLRNESTDYGKTGIRISSVETDRMYYKRRNTPVLTKEEMDVYLGGCEKDRFNILLAHNPDHFAAYRQWGAQLVLSGHVHGGIIRLPLLGGVISPRVTFFPRYDGGRFDEDGTVMVISRGLGSHTIPLRLWNPGELIKIELR